MAPISIQSHPLHAQSSLVSSLEMHKAKVCNDLTTHQLSGAIPLRDLAFPHGPQVWFLRKH